MCSLRSQLLGVAIVDEVADVGFVSKKRAYYVFAP